LKINIKDDNLITIKLIKTCHEFIITFSNNKNKIVNVGKIYVNSSIDSVSPFCDGIKWCYLDSTKLKLFWMKLNNYEKTLFNTIWNNLQKFVNKIPNDYKFIITMLLIEYMTCSDDIDEYNITNQGLFTIKESQNWDNLKKFYYKQN
jgi:hypothetical protein